MGLWIQLTYPPITHPCPRSRILRRLPALVPSLVGLVHVSILGASIQPLFTALEKERDLAQSNAQILNECLGQRTSDLMRADERDQLTQVAHSEEAGRLMTENETLKSQLESQTLYIDGLTRNKAREMCGEVMRHKTTTKEYPEIGVVECDKSFAAIETLISVNELAKSLLEKADGETKRLTLQYHELLMSVAQKYEGETRHETALRYIQERENRSCEDTATDVLTPAKP